MALVLIATTASLPQASTPTFSPVAGTYTSAQSVTISCSTPSSTIYYTSDGSTPTPLSTVYSGPISVSVSETLRAIATAAGYTQSAVGGAAYTINVGFNPPFPRLASMRFQNATYNTQPYFNNPAQLSWLANRCIYGIGINYTGSSVAYFGSSGRNAWVVTQKAATNVAGGNRIVQYVDPMQYNGTNPTPPAGGDASHGVLYSNIDANNWLYRSTYPSGTPQENGSYYYANISTYTAANSSGQQYGGFFAQYFYQFFISGSGPYASPAPSVDAASSLDGVYLDDSWFTPLENGDVECNGTTQSVQTVVTNTGSGLSLVADNWRAGQAQFFTELEAQKPGLFRFSNTNYVSHLWQYNGYSTGTDPTLVGSMNQVLDATELQFFFGDGYHEGSATFANIIAAYQFATAYCRASGPQIPILDIAFLSGVGTTAYGNSGNGIPGSSATAWSANQPSAYTPAYQGMRYYTGLTLCAGNGAIMCDGYVAYSDINLQTYDEWGDYSQSGSCPCGFLGYPVNDSTGAIQTAPKYVTGSGTGVQRGIWERRFYNPNTNRYYRSVFNPRGNGAVVYNPTNSVGAGVTLWKLRGTQNSSYNNAASFTSLALADTDGGIFCESAT